MSVADATDCFLLFHNFYFPPACLVLHSPVSSSLPASYFSTALKCSSFFSCLLNVDIFRVLSLSSSSSHSPESLWMSSFVPMASLTHLLFFFSFYLNFPPGFRVITYYQTYNGNLPLEVTKLPQIPNYPSF